jgi:hypothetical protein
MSEITREYKNAQYREWYHKVDYGKYKNRYSKLRRLKIRKWLIEYKSHLKCKCGENDIACLVFHHKDPSKKEINIGEAINRGWSIKRLTKELMKCEVMCSNCHRKLHYADYYKDEEIPELTDEEKPKYLGYHGNGMPPLPFEQTHTMIECDACGKIFPRKNTVIRRQIKRGCTRVYCSKECLAKFLGKSRQQVKSESKLIKNLICQNKVIVDTEDNIVWRA